MPNDADLAALEDVAGKAKDALTKARGVKYSDAEAKALKATKEVASALDTLRKNPRSAAAVQTIRTSVKDLEGVRVKLTDEKDKRAVDAAASAGRKALEIVAPGVTVAAAQAQEDARMLRDAIPTSMTRLRALATQVENALRSGNPIQVERVREQVNEELPRYDIDTAGFAIAQALAALTEPPPQRPDWFDPRVWDQEQAEARAALASAIDIARDRSIHLDPTLAELVPKAVMWIWWVSRDPSDTARKGWLRGLIGTEDAPGPLREAERARKGRPERGKLADLIQDVRTVAEMRDTDWWRAYMPWEWGKEERERAYGFPAAMPTVIPSRGQQAQPMLEWNAIEVAEYVRRRLDAGEKLDDIDAELVAQGVSAETRKDAYVFIAAEAEKEMEVAPAPVPVEIEPWQRWTPGIPGLPPTGRPPRGEPEPPKKPYVPGPLDFEARAKAHRATLA